MINRRQGQHTTLHFILLIILSFVLIACTESQYNDEQKKLLSKYKYGIENRGKLYFIEVCSDCHRNNYSIRIPPHQFTMAQWHEYLIENRHNIKGDTQPLFDFFSQTYKSNRAENNTQLQLVLDVQDEELMLDVAKYLLNGAKDADTPKSCSQ